MKSIVVLSACLLLVGGVVVAAIVGSAHDLRTYGGVPQATTQVCVYCHTPHNANTDTTRTSYLWNRDVSATDYTVYDGTYTDPLANTSHTLACMSCHDGTTTAIGQMLNPPFDYTGDQDAIYVTGDANLGTDLSNDHPIDLVYLNDSEGGPLPSTWYHDSATVTAAGIVFFTFGANTHVMTCASCHEPHNKTSYGAFLRVDPNDSAICTTCHNI